MDKMEQEELKNFPLVSSFYDVMKIELEKNRSCYDKNSKFLRDLLENWLQLTQCNLITASQRQGFNQLPA